jgi:hypothetical protein
MKKFIAILMVFGLGACVSYDHYYELPENYLAVRQMQTRNFETKDEDAMLTAAAQVLQDLEFTISESETKLGMISATKNREAGSTGEKVFAALFGGRNATYDTEQKIYATVVSTHSKNRGYNVRLVLSRTVWNNRGQPRSEEIDDEDIYRDFFNKLGQSMFLTANDI